MKNVKFKTNINCNSCVQSVTPFLNELDNVDDWKVALESTNKVLEVNLDDENDQTVIDAVKNAGFEIAYLK